jgi:hypothetical protein
LPFADPKSADALLNASGLHLVQALTVVCSALLLHEMHVVQALAAEGWCIKVSMGSASNSLVLVPTMVTRSKNKLQVLKINQGQKGRTSSVA